MASLSLKPWVCHEQLTQIKLLVEDARPGDKFMFYCESTYRVMSTHPPHPSLSQMLATQTKYPAIVSTKRMG